MSAVLVPQVLPQARPYQTGAIDRARDLIRAGTRRILIVAPTGSGKTFIGVSMARGAIARQRRCLWLTHRAELISQVSGKLDELGLDHGIIQADNPRRRPWTPIQIASVPTLMRRIAPPEAPVLFDASPSLPLADIVFVDEAHHATAEGHSRILKAYPNAIVVGLTATPYRLDGGVLGDHFDELLEVASILDLTAEGYLVPARVIAPEVPRLQGIRTSAGDYNQRDLAALMDRPHLVGNVVQTWLEMARGRTTVVFATSIEHSQHIAARFCAAGIRAEHLDADTPGPERRDILARVSSGETTVVTNVGILTEGWDLPRVSCVSMARPTMSRSLCFQMVGRGLRSYPGKTDCIVLDHSYNTWLHGLVTEPQEFSLTVKGKKRKAGDPDAEAEAAVKRIRCKQCLTIYAATGVEPERCTFCGAEAPKRPPRRPIQERRGSLKEVGPAQGRAAAIPTEQRIKTLAKWIRKAADNGWKPSQPKVIYRRWFGIECDPATYERALAISGRTV